MNEFVNPDPVPHTAPMPPSPDLVVKRLPRIFRLQSLIRLPGDMHHVINRAVLFHEAATLTVEWVSRRVDVRLEAGCLVSVCWRGRPVSLNGAVRIARLVRLDRPEAALNIFDTVPRTWGIDRALLRRAAVLWDGLPAAFAQLFNAVFWDGQRLQRFLTGPSSLNGHHAERFGNLRHSVEVAELALHTAERVPRMHRGVAVLAALLHDAGKADEYRLGHDGFVLSDRGQLIGHRTTIVEWIAVARARHCETLPESHYLALLHSLTSAKGAPPWLGLREPQTLEATIVSFADRLSGYTDLVEQHAPRHSGFGRYHPHLKCRPFMLPEEEPRQALRTRVASRPAG